MTEIHETDHIEQVSYRRIGINRDKPRLWIEGLKLTAAGFRRGDNYVVDISKRRLTIRKAAVGGRKVSGRSRNGVDIPIIDIEARALVQGFAPESRVRIIFSRAKIVVTVHHEEEAKRRRESRFRDAQASRQISEASLFTGAGVSTLAVHTALADAGYDGEVKWVVDVELKYLQVARRNNYAITDETCAIVGKVEEVENDFFAPVDILSFSMPCAGFSRAGRSKHKLTPETHESATAVFGVVNAIRAANPAILLSENVVEAQHAPAYQLLKAELNRLGYVIFEKLLDNAESGTIERRRRYWFVAISEGLAEGFTFDIEILAGAECRATIGSILDKHVPETAWSQNEYLHKKAKSDQEAGKGFKRQLLTGKETICGAIGRHYNKRRSTEPMLQRPDGKERLFTPQEHARLKSIPEELVDGAPATTAHEVLGQSIDFRQAYLCLKSVIGFLAGKQETMGRGIDDSGQAEFALFQSKICMG